MLTKKERKLLWTQVAKGEITKKDAQYMDTGPKEAHKLDMEQKQASEKTHKRKTKVKREVK